MGQIGFSGRRRWRGAPIGPPGENIPALQNVNFPMREFSMTNAPKLRAAPLDFMTAFRRNPAVRVPDPSPTGDNSAASGDRAPAFGDLRFQRLVSLASDIFDAPTAAIAVLDRDALSFKGAVGLESASIGDLNRLIYQTVAARHPLTIIDAPRAAETSFAFFAGGILRDKGGRAIGALVLAGSEPRDFDDRLQRRMSRFMEIVERELERPEAVQSESGSVAESSSPNADPLAEIPNLPRFRAQLASAWDRVKDRDGLVGVLLVGLDQFQLLYNVVGIGMVSCLGER